jgi:predicted RNase H-like HicB family nuclease
MGTFIMPKQPLVCIATGQGDEWEAFCLDFDLAVQGRSFEEVKCDLRQAINMYVEAALAEPEPARSRLLSRDAPFFIRLMWAWRLFIVTISRRANRDISAPIEFPVTCPA